ncbi:proline-rich protein PRCC isoform X1 [Sinocyclocheilus rhinocerous]|uniref:proline-rich protein PRCC isoform X1 n=1 Tax=Sinocyclocheilus rhinocerous TaxID=307959 RepID=UPI0007BA5D3C|nr:PREDICTED: proline-rich protein PRCC-like isoform X1 [Sinocyclocheilus rhinocerous]
MSLVAYDSSDDSDRDESPASPLRPAGKIGGLFTSLPAPKTADQTSAPQPKRMTIDLPKPKKRTEPVKITVPEIKPADSDSDDDEPVRKKSAPRGGGGLSSLLPQPKNLVVKETARPLLPHTLTKRPGSDKPKATPAKSQALSGSSPSPSAIKAAAKSAALQLAKQMAADEEGSDDELAPENYFSLPESSAQPVMSQNPHSQQYIPSLHPPPGVEDAPLDFVPNADSHSRSAGAMQDYESGEYQHQYPANPLPETSPQDYYGEGYYQDPNPAADEQEDSGSSSLFNDEAVRRLQGKQNRGREEIKFLEIKGDDQLSGNKQWLTKNMTAEAEPRKSFSKKKGDQPTGQQRRKHQITYLIHQAKERELELKNNWAENKLTRRQTQAKYGF